MPLRIHWVIMPPSLRGWVLLFDARWRQMVRGVLPGRLDPYGIRRARSASRTGFAWPGGVRAALSISFDDARPSQIRCGVPLMERLAVTSTFFVLPGAVAADQRGWAAAVEHGHAIGTHTVLHP